MFHWAGVAVLNHPKYHSRYAALRPRGHSYGRALRGVGDRLLGVTCVLLQWGYRSTLIMVRQLPRRLRRSLGLALPLPQPA